MNKTLSVAALGFALALACNAQTALLNTTITAAVNASQTVVPVASATNVTGVGNSISISAIGAGSGNAL